MKISIDGLHKAFESRIRLGIMSALAVNETLDFNSLKEYLDITDGNLASHIKALENENFIGIEKSFVGKKPNSRYFIHTERREAFNHHLLCLETSLK